MSKFFDYITSGAPIIVFGPRNSNLSRIVEEDGAGKAFECSDVDAAADYIACLSSAAAPNTRNICSKWSAQRMAQRVQDLIVSQAQNQRRY